MPYRCCVLMCRGNYDANGPKVAVFGFPRDPDLRNQWLQWIKRKHFVPTKASKVCELHFEPNLIEKKTTFRNETTGEVLEAPLKIPRLVKGAIPTKLPGCPFYMSQDDIPIRVSPETKRLTMSCRDVERAITEGQPAGLEDENNPDWVPSQHMGYESVVVGKRKDDVDIQGRPSDDPGNPDFAPSLHLEDAKSPVLKQTTVPVQPIVQTTNRRVNNQIAHGCCVPGCAGCSGADCYSFPQSQLLINMWKGALKISKIPDVTKLFVCKQHFDERDFVTGTNKLKKMAIPSVQRNDNKPKRISVLEKRTDQCNCECTCEKKQNSPKSTVLDLMGLFHNYAKPLEEQPCAAEAAPEENNENDYLKDVGSNNMYEMNRKSKFEGTDNKDSTIVVYDKFARVVITSHIPSLRVRLAHEVRKVLDPRVSDIGENLDKNLASSKASKELMIDLTTGIQKNNDDERGMHVSDERTAKAFDEILRKAGSLKKKYDELAQSFGTKCPYCEFTERDIVFHVRRVHYALFPQGQISADDIYKELINEIEALQKDEDEFPANYLNNNFKVHCQYCGEDFMKIAALIAHVKAIHESSCGPLPLNEAQLMSGMKNCKFCNRILNNSEEYTSHVARCISNPAVKGNKEAQVCEFCGVTGSRNQVKSHRNRFHTHRSVDHGGTGTKRFICEICGRSLALWTSYKNHLLRHENKREVKCPEEGCNKLFNTAACLQRHKSTHLPPEKWKFACDECGKRFPYKKGLLKHQDTHSRLPSMCMQCGKTFKGKYALQVHLANKHTDTWGKRRWVVSPKGGAGVTTSGEVSNAMKRKRVAPKTVGGVKKGEGGGNCENASSENSDEEPSSKVRRREVSSEESSNGLSEDELYQYSTGT